MEWKVTNALNRDVERQHLNKILAEIQAAVQNVEVKQKQPPAAPVLPPSNRQPFTLTLTGDVTGSASIGAGSSTLETTLSVDAVGIEEAPDTGQAYWRRRGEWEVVPTAVESLDYLEGSGFIALDVNGDFTPRTIEGVEDQIDVDNGEGLSGNPVISLANLENTQAASGPVKIYTRDSKGRIEGDVDATTDDLPEGANNLYYTDERVEDVISPLIEGMLTYEGLKDTLVAGANVIITADDVDETITITSTGGGGGGGTIEAIIGGIGIEVDDTVPEAPVVSLSDAVLDSLTLADSAVQPADLALVATTGEYTDLLGLPTLGTMAAEDAADYTPTVGLGSAAFEDVTFFATAAQGALAGTALQTGDNISELVNDADYADVTYVDGKVANTLTDGVTDVAPSQNAVFDALAGKQDFIPIGTPGQFYRGDKTFANSLDGDIRLNGVGSALRTDASPNSYVTLRDGVVGVTVSSNGGIRFLVSGGIEAFRFQAGAALYSFAGAPFSDSLASWGSASNRWSAVYAATGSINTSDARDKTAPRDLTATEIACALDIARLPSVFQWLSSIEEKGEEAARLHVSPTVQDVIACMESHGLDPFRYSFVCYDSWPELPEIVESWDEERDEDGNVTREAGSEVVQTFRAAGDRYSLRPSGLDAFCRRALVADRDKLEARLAALENN